MIALLKKEWQALPLSPAERAVLKVIWSVLLGAFLLGTEAGFDYLTTQRGITNYWPVVRDAVVIALFTMAHTVLTYIKANGSAQLQVAATLAESQIPNLEKQLLSDGARGTLSVPVVNPSAPTVAMNVPQIPPKSR